MSFIALLLLVVSVGAAREFTGEDVASFPKLFHLDEYERCLAKVDGVYCHGIFDLTPAKLPHPTYELMKIYSEDSHNHFNRTRIHRGYCVSTRCPTPSLASIQLEKNTTLSFERCVDRYAQLSGFRASLRKFNYCRTHIETITVHPLTTAQQMFLLVICVLVLANIVGTIYDYYAGDNPNKNKLLSSFSIPVNWGRLTVIHEGGDPRITALSPLQGVRIIVLTSTTVIHAGIFHFMSHTVNPEFFEQVTQKWEMAIVYGSISIIQGLVLITCFLTGYFLLIISEKYELSLNALPLLVIKRLVRIYPVYLLIIVFGMTWWLKARDGPLVPIMVGLESEVCKNKFWYHVFFLNNIVDAKNYCVAPTWFLSMNMHVYLISCILTLLLWRRRSSAIKVYAVLFIASGLMTGIISYINEYKSVINAISPEQAIRIFRDTPTFTDFYMSSWGGLQACFVGLMLAHIHYELNEKKIKLSEYKWYVYLHYLSVLGVFFIWPYTNLIAYRQNRLFEAAFIAVDRSVYLILAANSLLGVFNIDGPMSRLTAWRGWHSMARMSVTVMMLHWCVNMTIISRQTTFATSVFDIAVDWAATTLITYLLAIPITILVELPVQKFLEALLLDDIIKKKQSSL